MSIKKKKFLSYKELRVVPLSLMAVGLFLFQRIFTRMKIINYPKNTFPCIFALWHAHQCAIWSIPDHEHLYSLVSQSNDGNIITAASNAVGLKIVRGSATRGGVQASLELLEKLEQNNSVALTIDGPRGPKRIVKQGIVHLAKLSQVPIVPFVWYCPSPLFLKFNTWDEFRFAIFAIKTIVVYGEPIYVPNELTKDQVEEYRLKVENSLKKLYDDAVENYHSYVKQ